MLSAKQTKLSWKAIAGGVFLSVFVWGLISPAGIRLAIKGNLWSIDYVRNQFGLREDSAVLSAPPVTKNSALLLARDAFDQGEFSKADQLLSPLLAKSDPLALDLHAEILFKQEKDVAIAFKIWRQLNNDLALQKAGYSLNGDDQTALVLMAFEYAYEIRPQNYESNVYGLRIALAQQDAAESQFDEALSLLQKNIAMRPADARGYNEIAWVYALNRQFPQAIANIEKAISLDPNKSGFYSRAGQIYEKAGQFSKALEDYHFALQLNPQNQDALEGVSRLSGARDTR